MIVRPRVLYLHGFASSSASTKARYFGERLEARGVSFRCPDLNEPDFRTLTMTRMLDRVAAELSNDTGGPATLLGSSLGGTLAILAAVRHGVRIGRLVLMAPAVLFAKPGHHLLPPERIEEWRQNGALPFFHYGYGEERLLDFGFYEDSLKYDAFAATFSQPTLIVQGLHDTVVESRTVERFARTRPSVTLSLLEDDHQLVASLPRIWQDVEVFLGLL